MAADCMGQGRECVQSCQKEGSSTLCRPLCNRQRKASPACKGPNSNHFLLVFAAYFYHIRNKALRYIRVEIKLCLGGRIRKGVGLMATDYPSNSGQHLATEGP